LSYRGTAQHSCFHSNTATEITPVQPLGPTSSIFRNLLVKVRNFGKRLVKTPKVYWGDSGLACYLLGITSVAELQRSPFLGRLYEGFVAAEILKSQVNHGGRKELYYFRDHQGLEVDFSPTQTECRTVADRM
jgi:predicted AAA+ superfamily ATPase